VAHQQLTRRDVDWAVAVTAAGAVVVAQTLTNLDKRPDEFKAEEARRWEPSLSSTIEEGDSVGVKQVRVWR
jgi:hypothetical protein